MSNGQKTERIISFPQRWLIVVLTQCRRVGGLLHHLRVSAGLQYFRPPQGQEPGEFMPVSLAMQIVGANITQKLSTVMLGRAFVDQGFERRTSNNVRGYIVVRRSPEEVQSHLRTLAYEDDKPF